MDQIVECVMNVSEGQDPFKIRDIAREIERVSDVFLLNSTSDWDHHRTVFSFIGSPVQILESAFLAVEKAVQLIDLRLHRGVHPRIGAVDVIPFVPLQGTVMHDCVAIAQGLGQRIAGELHIPVYLYGEAASSDRRRETSAVRRIQFEGLAEEIRSNPLLQPDYGQNRLHPSAGATLVGARPVLIAYNVFLKTPDLEVANRIVSRIRERSGGLPGIRALGFYLRRRDLAQVSINVVDYHKASLLEIFGKVQKEARDLGTEVESSEIVGLVPEEALRGIPAAELKLEDFHPDQILERRIAQVLGKRLTGDRLSGY